MLLSIGSFQHGEVAADIGFDFLHPPLQLGASKVTVTIVDRLELAAVDGHQRFGQQTELLAQHQDAADGLTKIGDGLEVRRQTYGQPHQFEVALSLSLPPATGLDAIEIAVDVDLQQNAGMVSGSTGFCLDDTVEVQPAEVEFIDEHIGHPHRIGVRDVIIQALRQQCALVSMLTLDEALNTPSPLTFVSQT